MPVSKLALNTCYEIGGAAIEIGIDEAGRGPMLGRVYSGAVILPKEGPYKHELMKDSKRFTSEKKIREVANYIKENAVAWGVGFATEKDIEQMNIRQATFIAMHQAIKQVLTKIGGDVAPYHLLVDGNDFKPYMVMQQDIGLMQIPHTCIKGGDNKYTAIAAGSILAKVTRDDYIADICDKDPLLDKRYGLLTNKGYGTKRHIEGIMRYGITEHHRKTFGDCRLHV